MQQIVLIIIAVILGVLACKMFADYLSANGFDKDSWRRIEGSGDDKNNN